MTQFETGLDSTVRPNDSTQSNAFGAAHLANLFEQYQSIAKPAKSESQPNSGSLDMGSHSSVYGNDDLAARSPQRGDAPQPGTASKGESAIAKLMKMLENALQNQNDSSSGGQNPAGSGNQGSPEGGGSGGAGGDSGKSGGSGGGKPSSGDGAGGDGHHSTHHHKHEQGKHGGTGDNHGKHGDGQGKHGDGHGKHGDGHGKHGGEGHGGGGDGGGSKGPGGGGDGGGGKGPGGGGGGGGGKDKPLVGSYINPKDYGVKSEEDAVKKYEEQTGHKMGINNSYQGFGKMPDTTLLKDDLKNGTVPMLSLTAGNSKDIADGKDDKYLEQLAKTLKSMPGNILLRYGYEMDNTHVEKNAGDPADFKKAWQHIYDIFQKEGATNVKFVWCPEARVFNQDYKGGPNAWYPGDKYVDYIGADGYGRGSDPQSFQNLFQKPDEFAKEHDKQFVVGETSIDSSKISPQQAAQWLDKADDWLKDQDNIYAVNFFQADHYKYNYMIDHSQTELDAFKQLLDSLQ